MTGIDQLQKLFDMQAVRDGITLISYRSISVEAELAMAA